MDEKSGTYNSLKTLLVKVFERKKNMEQIAKCKLLTAVFEADNLILGAVLRDIFVCFSYFRLL